MISRLLSLLLLLSILSPTYALPESTSLSGQLGERVAPLFLIRDRIYKVSPDGTKVFYTGVAASAPAGFNNRRELFVVNVDGKNPRLILDHDRFGPVFSIAFSSDSRFAVVEAGGRLYSINLSSFRIATLDFRMSERKIQISPDNEFVVFSGLFDSEFYSVPIGGGTLNRLDNLNFATLDGSSFQISSDSRHVYFQALEDSTFDSQIVQVPILGGSNRLLLSGDFNDLLSWTLTPDDSNIVYTLLGASTTTLNSVNVSTASSRLLDQTFDSFGGISFRVFPNSQSVLYSKSEFSNNEFESNLFVVPVNGGSAAKEFVGLGDFSTLCSNFVNFSDDSTEAVVCIFSSESDTIEFHRLSLSRTINSQQIAPRQVFSSIRSEHKFIGGGEKLLVASTSGGENSDPFRSTLVLVDTRGDLVTVIADFSSRSLGCVDGLFRHSGEIVVICEDLGGDSTFGLSAINISTRLGEPLVNIVPSSENPDFFSLTPDGQFLLYASQQETDSGLELTINSIDLDDAGLISSENDLCFPIVISEGKVSVICL